MLNKVQLIWERGFDLADRFNMVKLGTLKLYNSHSFNPLTGSNTESYTDKSNIKIMFVMSKTKRLENTRLQKGEVRTYIKTADIPGVEISTSDLIVVVSDKYQILRVNKDGSNAVYILTLQLVGAV